MFRNGVERSLGNNRLYYWIIQGRSFVNIILKNCYLCKLFLGEPIMPPKTLSFLDYRLYCMFPIDVYSHCYELVVEEHHVKLLAVI